MKSNNILQIGLVIAVVILYILHFTKGSNLSEGDVAAEEKGASIYYINIDTLNNKLDFLVEKQAALEQKEIEAEDKFRVKAAALERDISAYQREAQGGYMTPKQMQTKEQTLGRRQQQLMQERDSIANSLLMESQQINEQLMKKLKKYLDEFNQENKAQFILAYSEASNILHADPSKDITKTIVNKMNEDKSE